MLPKGSLNMTTEKLLFDSGKISAGMQQLCEAVLRDFKKDPEYVLLGLHKQGVPLAERIAAYLEEKTGTRPAVGKLDISMYRDDIGLRSGLPLIRETAIPFNMENAKVILVDDVLSSGRAIRAALDAVTSFGRPACIRLAVLLDRGRPEFPIRADYAGMNAFDVDPAEKIVLKLTENDGEDAAVAIQWR